jgi:hypothetical protein
MAVKPVLIGLKRIGAVERLRERTGRSSDRLALKTAKKIVGDIVAGRSLRTIATRSKLERDFVLDVVSNLGTWLTHVHGGVGYEAEVPAGFERGAGHGRDVVRSVVSIMVYTPDAAEISRWLDHLYPSTTGVIGGADLYSFGLLAQLGRLEEIDQMTPTVAYAQIATNTFDLFDVAVADAKEAIGHLRVVAETGELGDLDELSSDLTKIAWLNENRVDKLRRLLDQTRGHSDAGSVNTLLREIGFFAKESERPEWNPLALRDLREGQIQRLAERAGLGLREDARKIESEMRSRLIDMGLKRDLSRLLPDAVLASQSGVEDEFWEAIAARQSGDAQWRQGLEKALKDHEVARASA